jgi:hypothetical protein
MEQNKFSESVKGLISITIDAVKIEKTTMVVFLILGIAIFFFTILSSVFATPFEVKLFSLI